MKVHACSPTAARYRTAFPAAAYRTTASPSARPTTPADQRKTRPAANVLRREGGFLIEMALPGISRDQVTVNVQDGFLVVRHNAGAAPETAGRYMRKEFDITGFERRFKLPDTIDVSGIEARFENGILYLAIPERKPEVKPIEIQ
jgi:HSP20 family protein